MFSRLIFATILLILASNSIAQTNTATRLHRFRFTEQKMGSPFSITIFSDDSTRAAIIAGRSFRLVDSLVMIFSDYIDSSELNRLCATAGRPDMHFIASPALFELLEMSKNAYELSGHSFDITLGPLTRLWRKSRKDNTWPSAALVKEKLAQTGSDYLLLDRSTRQVKLLKQGMQLDPGGIAQGYIAEKVIRQIESEGIRNALVDVSGDITCIGAPPGSAGWVIGINVPEDGEQLLTKKLLISNKSVTTSGNVYQYMEHEGKKYSHVIDPATGYGLTSSRNVTVIANDCTSADWLTKAFSILPEKKAKKLAKRLQVQFLVAEIREGKLSYYNTPGFDNYWKATSP